MIGQDLVSISDLQVLSRKIRLRNNVQKKNVHTAWSVALFFGVGIDSLQLLFSLSANIDHQIYCADDIFL